MCGTLKRAWLFARAIRHELSAPFFHEIRFTIHGCRERRRGKVSS